MFENLTYSNLGKLLPIAVNEESVINGQLAMIIVLSFWQPTAMSFSELSLVYDEKKVKLDKLQWGVNHSNKKKKSQTNLKITNRIELDEL